MTPRPGYTLPVFACAAAIAALKHLQTPQSSSRLQVSLDLLDPPETVTLPIEQVAQLAPHTALAITRSDPGDNLDLTRHTPLWAVVTLNPPGQTEPLRLVGGEGVGHHEQDGRPAIYGYARRLLAHNLLGQVGAGDRLSVTIILPEGQALADRTSNAAFGVVQGLALLGTNAIAQPLSAPEQLAQFQADLEAKAQHHQTLVFCIGENGLDLAQKLHIPPAQTLKTANWLGPLLVAAALQGVRQILLLGYHGKLVKLAGGIFHTHHHVADGRLEILTAQGLAAGLPGDLLSELLASATVEAALGVVRDRSQRDDRDWVALLYGEMAARIDRRAADYIYQHTGATVPVGCLLFDRRRQTIITSPQGQSLLQTIQNPSP